jgi:hypothetical protein
MANSFGLQLLGDAPRHYTSRPEYLSQLRLDGGFPLPESFQRFAQELGYGTLCGDLVIDVPFERNAECCPALTSTLAGARAALLSSLEYVEADEQPLYRRLLPFGSAGAGQQLCWDPEAPAGPGSEVAIYVAADNTAWRVGKSFDEMIEKLTRAGGARPFGRAYPRTFKPYLRCQAIHVQLQPPTCSLERRLEVLRDALAPARWGMRFDLEERLEQRLELEVPPLDVERLLRVGVPEAFHEQLLTVPSRDALLAVQGVPDEWLLKLHDDTGRHPARATLSYTEWRQGSPRHSLWVSTTPRHEAACLTRLRGLLRQPAFQSLRVYDVAGDDPWGLMESLS